MRLFFVILIFSFCSLNLKGQSGVMSHLFKDQSNEFKPFVSFTAQFSEIALQYSVIPGVRAGVIINNKYAIGGCYQSTLGEISLAESKGSGKLRTQYGGLLFEYTLWSVQKIHLSLPLLVGLGQLKVTGSNTAPVTGSPNFYFIEPGWLIEADIWKYIKLGIGTSYRYTPNVSYNTLSGSDISGFSAIVSIRLGRFK